MEDSQWPSSNFRQKVVSQIEEAVRKAGIVYNKTSKEMENHIYMKAKSREEYLSLLARLINLFRDIYKKKSQASVAEVVTMEEEEEEEDEEDEGQIEGLPEGGQPAEVVEEGEEVDQDQPRPGPVRWAHRASAGRVVHPGVASLLRRVLVMLQAQDRRLRRVELLVGRLMEHTGLEG